MIIRILLLSAVYNTPLALGTHFDFISFSHITFVVLGHNLFYSHIVFDWDLEYIRSYMN